MSDDAIYATARAAVVRYLREIALLPSFPSEVPISETVPSETVSTPVLRVVATNKVRGEVLPRTDDAWLAIRPFHDIKKATLSAWATALVERRMAAIALLVRLSAAPQFGWAATMDCGGQRVTRDPQSSFWIDLLRDLNPDALYDRLMSLERNLVALSRSPSPRFLFCVDSDPSQIDVGELLDQMLWSDATNAVEGADGKTVYDDVLEACGLTKEPIRRTIDVGLSFTTGKITHTLLGKIFDVQNRLQSRERPVDGIRFRLTALRIGSDCEVQVKALETIHSRWGQELALTNVSLGSIENVKAAAVQECLVRLVNEPTSKLRRLAVAAGDAFPAVASVFRCASASSIQEVDVVYRPTDEFAAWLAFAFFHVDSQSTVSSLCLRTFPDHTFFSHTWIAAFERALQTPTASEDLTGEEEDDEGRTARTFVTIKAMTPVKSHPYSGAKLLCKLPSDPSEREYERIGQVKKLVGVIIPGMGVGWVPQASIVATRSEPSLLTFNATIQTNRRITSLSIDRTGQLELRQVTELHIASMLQLVAAIGEWLERLDLPDCHFEPEHLAQILRSCPNLKVLNISGHCIANINPLVDAYTANQCNIESLSLSYPFSASIHDTTVEQLTALLREKPTLPLRRLTLRLISHHSAITLATWTTTELAEALAVALSENHLLEFVQLTARTASAGNSTRPPHPLPLDFSCGWSSDPLPLSCKLAFLSIVQQENDRGKNARCRLDAHTLSLIFAFSREAVARHILRCS